MGTFKIAAHARHLTLIFCLSSATCFARQWPDDHARAQTLRLLPPDTTQELLTAACSKCALLFYGANVTTTLAQSNTILLAVNGPPNSSIGAGVAVAIDERGYFLTAAHVVEERPPFTLVFSDGRQMRSAPARIVAQIHDDKKRSHGLDLALLHVEGVHLTKVFAWSGSDKPASSRSIVMQVGEAAKEFSDTNVVIQLDAVAGHLKKVTRVRRGGAIVKSDVPGRPGDSGGPLLNSDGELLGITFGIRFSILGMASTVATRPDLEWLRKTIAADQLAPPHHPDTPLPNVGEPGYLTVRLLKQPDAE